MSKQNSSYLMIGGGVLLALGSFLPWASLGGESVNGFSEGASPDGIVILIGGLLFAAAGFMAMQGNMKLKWAGLAGLVVAGGLALIDFFDVLGNEFVDTGIGMYIMVLGTIAGVVGVVMMMRGGSEA